jgi:hypothetical protein
MLEINTTGTQIIISGTDIDTIGHAINSLGYQYSDTTLLILKNTTVIIRANWADGITLNGEPVTKENVKDQFDIFFLVSSDGNSGITDHDQLSNRNAADQHPIDAVTGLQERLTDIESTVDELKNLGNGVGHFDTAVDMPMNIISYAPIKPTINDFVTVNAISSEDSRPAMYRIIAIAADGTITYSTPLIFSIDITGKIDKIVSPTAGKLVRSKSDGNVEESTVLIQSSEIADGAITEVKLKDLAVTNAKITNSGLQDIKIGTRALTNAAADSTLITVDAKLYTDWLQGIRSNLKYLFSLFTNGKANAALVADNIAASGTVGQVLTSQGNSTEPMWSDIAGNSLINYSEIEQFTGMHWLDGKKIYQKTINFGKLPNNTSINVLHNIANLNYIVNMYAVVTQETISEFSAFMPLTYALSTSNGQTVTLSANMKNVSIATGADRSTYMAYVTFQSTCTNR